MQQLPVPNQPFSIGWSVVALLALGLVLLAFVAVITVLLAARRPIFPFQHIKTAALTLLWVVPALAVVGMIGFRAEPRRVDHFVLPAQSQSAIRGELRSTSRQISSKTAPTIVIASETKTAESVTGAAPIVAEAQETSPAASAGRRRQHQDVNLSNSLPADKVLKVLETRSGAPDWAEKEPQPSDKGTLVSLSSERFATLQEAEQQLTAKAVSFVKDFYHEEYPLTGDWTVPISLIERSALRNLVGETFNKDFGSGIQGTMYRAHLQLELNSALRQGLHDSWRGQIVSHRLIGLGSMLGLVTIMLATSAGYFRLDDLTGGLYRRRLRFAAASLIAAASLVAVVVV
jgi:hypothetical protein